MLDSPVAGTSEGLHRFVSHVGQVVAAHCPNARYDYLVRRDDTFDGFIFTVTDNELNVSAQKSFTCQDWLMRGVLPPVEFAGTLLLCLHEQQKFALKSLEERGGSPARELPSAVSVATVMSSMVTGSVATDSPQEKSPATDADSGKDCDYKVGPESAEILGRLIKSMDKLNDTIERFLDGSAS